MAFGVGAFTQGVLKVLREDGAEVSTYLTRDYAHYPPSLEGPTFTHTEFPDPCELLRSHPVDVVSCQLDKGGAIAAVGFDCGHSGVIE